MDAGSQPSRTIALASSFSTDEERGGKDASPYHLFSRLLRLIIGLAGRSFDEQLRIGLPMLTEGGRLFLWLVHVQRVLVCTHRTVAGSRNFGDTRFGHL